MSSEPEAEWHDSCVQAINQRRSTEQQQQWPGCLYDSNYVLCVSYTQLNPINFTASFVSIVEMMRQTREALRNEISPPINIHVDQRKVDAKGRGAAIRRRSWYQTVVCAMSACEKISDLLANESVTPTRTKKQPSTVSTTLSVRDGKQECKCWEGRKRIQ
jgi:hypothetical protein